MKRLGIFLATALLLGAASSAGAANASFGCDARAPGICYFIIFYYPQYNRQIVLPAGMKATIPGITIGRDRYCGATGKPPPHKCQTRLINANYNN